MADFFSSLNRERYAWWNSLSPIQRWAPWTVVALYWFTLYKLDGFHGDLVVASGVGLLLYYLGPKARPVFEFLLPLFLTIVIYDSQRYYADYIRGPIHVREPYDFDKRFFGITTANGVLTPNEWLQIHTHPILDFFTGISYLIFVPVFVLCAGYFRFWVSRRGTRFSHPRSVLYRSPQVMWAFFWVNMIGYSTYYWYAASPPWYVALHGFGPARLDVPANIAGCVRFDQLLGMSIFTKWYGRSADVHGAIPSLHVAYPFIAMYWAFRFGALRAFTTFFYLLVCFAAVYLNHHYIIDVILGTLYAVIVAFGLDMWWNHSLKKKDILVPGPDPEGVKEV